jgi:HEAT repeat protein
MIHLAKKHKQPQAAALLVQAVSDTSPTVRTEAIRLAGYVQSTPQLNSALLRGLQDQDTGVRALAARSLGWHGKPEAFDAIRPLLKDDNAAVRDRALQAMANIDEARTKGLEELEVLREDSHPPLARRAKKLLK